MELDGEPIHFQEKDKWRILSWASGGVNNLQDGVGLYSGDQDESQEVGFWELLTFKNTQDKKYGIVFCEYDERERKQTPKQYACFSGFARGELKLYGVYIEYSIGLGAVCGSGVPYKEIIRGDFIYKFKIDIVNGNPKMSVFEKGEFEVHADLEVQQVTNEI